MDIFFLLFVSTDKESVAKGLAEDTTESENAVSIGTVCVTVMAVLGLGVILLDLNKLFADCRVGRDNVRHGLKLQNKVEDVPPEQHPLQHYRGPVRA